MSTVIQMLFEGVGVRTVSIVSRNTVINEV